MCCNGMVLVAQTRVMIPVVPHVYEIGRSGSRGVGKRSRAISNVLSFPETAAHLGWDHLVKPP